MYNQEQKTKNHRKVGELNWYETTYQDDPRKKPRMDLDLLEFRVQALWSRSTAWERTAPLRRLNGMMPPASGAQGRGCRFSMDRWRMDVRTGWAVTPCDSWLLDGGASTRRRQSPTSRLHGGNMEEPGESGWRKRGPPPIRWRARTVVWTENVRDKRELKMKLHAHLPVCLALVHDDWKNQPPWGRLVSPKNIHLEQKIQQAATADTTSNQGESTTTHAATAIREESTRAHHPHRSRSTAKRRKARGSRKKKATRGFF